MKWLILLAILVFVGWLIYFRYRKQIKAVLEVARVLRQLQKGEMPNLPMPNQTPLKDVSAQKIPKVDKQTSKNLVRCETCGSWLTPEKVIRFGNSKLSYCSTKCLEKAAIQG